MKRSLVFSVLGLVLSMAACHSRALVVRDAAVDAVGDCGAGGKAGAAAGTDGAAAGAGAVADASSDADASASDASPDASLGRDPQCPDSPQNLKTLACTPGFTCDYRAPGAYPTCIDRLQCVNANGGWSMVRSSQNCQKPTNDPSCPATFSALAQGTDCDDWRIGTCTYDEGPAGVPLARFGGLPTQGDWECQRWGRGRAGLPVLAAARG